MDRNSQIVEKSNVKTYMVEKDLVKEGILDVASVFFSKFGFKKTTIDEIAQAAHKGKSSVYYYFTSKEEIFKAVLEKEAAVLIEKLMLVINKKTSAEEKFREYIQVRLFSIKELVNFYTAIMSEVPSHLDFAAEMRNQYDIDEIRLIKIILNEGSEAGVFRFRNIEDTAAAITTVMKGLELPIYLFKRENDLEKKIAQMTDLILYGIVKN